MKKILVVDDNKDIVDILEIAFQARGYDVFKLCKGNKVIDTVNKFSPDVILLDVFLGGINGLDICSQLKNDIRTKQIPLIMFSAHSNREDVLKSCPADDFVSKPFDIYKITDVVASHLEGEISA